MFDWKDCVSLRRAMMAISLTFLAPLPGFAEEIDATELIQQMSAEIAGLDRFVVQGDAYADARLDAGQIIEHSSHVTLRLQRKPGAVRITNRDSENTREIFFDDGKLSVYSENDNFYAQKEMPQGLPSILDFAVNEVGIDSPMLDLVAADIAGHILEGAEEVGYLGTSLIRDEVFHHVGVRTREVDVQVWIAAEGRPLPGKLAISSKWEGGAPRFVSFFEWDTKPEFPRNFFKFDPPDGAVAVDFVVDLNH